MEGSRGTLDPPNFGVGPALFIPRWRVRRGRPSGMEPVTWKVHNFEPWTVNPSLAFYCSVSPNTEPRLDHSGRSTISLRSAFEIIGSPERYHLHAIRRRLNHGGPIILRRQLILKPVIWKVHELALQRWHAAQPIPKRLYAPPQHLVAWDFDDLKTSGH
jgi:hypothetical protein